MDIYTLDTLFRRQYVCDTYESFIWTERFSDIGDFTLVLASTNANRAMFPVDTMISIDSSKRVMVVETVEDKTDDQGSAKLTIKGRSLEKIFQDRLARSSLTDGLTANPKWVITDDPKAIATKIFHDICVTGVVSTNDIIPDVVEGSIFPTDTIAAPIDDITYEILPTDMYTALKKLCDAYDMGFRLVRDPTTTTRYFDIYMGSNRSTGQTDYPAVVFSPEFENLKNVTRLETAANAKNVAYVVCPVMGLEVWAPGVDSTQTGFKHRAIYIQADDLTDDSDLEVLASLLTQRGLDELKKYRSFSGFDGESTPGSKFKYGVDYHLGDIVELQNGEGGANRMQVTEYIFASDSEGERSYPTLSFQSFVTPNVWAGWDFEQVWDDYDTAPLDTVHWSDLP